MATCRLGRWALALAVCAIVATSLGCAQPGVYGSGPKDYVVNYAKFRVQDALEMIDGGLTITKTPQIGLYWNSLDVFPFGYSKLDGWFIGWGGNQLGITRHYDYCYGFGFAHQEIGWGEGFDKNDPKTLYVDNAGIISLFVPPWQYEPGYTPACVHFFPHIAYVGLVWNARWYEILDFMVGFSTIDLSGDDGVRIGKWPWQAKPQWVGPEQTPQTQPGPAKTPPAKT